MLTRVIPGLLALAVLLSACSSMSDDTADSEGTANSGSLGATQMERLEAAINGRSVVPGTTSGTGIHVSGSGSVAAQPDIAILSLSVETLKDKVAEAREAAARGINAILNALDTAGIARDDIETSRFSIQPQYEYPRDGRRILTGYQVINGLTVTLRDFDAIGSVIDSAVAAGGDATRVGGISFRVEDTEALEATARVLALKDVIAKADLYAEQTGVSRGKLAFINETSSSPFLQEKRLDSAMTREMAVGTSIPTQVLAGELNVRIQMQAVFNID